MRTIRRIVKLSLAKHARAFLVKLPLMSEASTHYGASSHADASQFKKPIEFDVHGGILQL
jgi:hypothetical protein